MDDDKQPQTGKSENIPGQNVVNVPPWKKERNLTNPALEPTHEEKDKKDEKEKKGDDQVVSGWGSLPRKKKILYLQIIVFTLIFISLVLYIVKRADFFYSHRVDRSYAVTEEIHETYLPVWEQFFMKKNGIDKDEFGKYFLPVSTDLEEDGLGEYFVIEYEYKVDWASFPLTDKLLIRNSSEEDYLSIDEIADLDKQGVGVYFGDKFVILDGIISESEVDRLVPNCYVGMKPASKPFKFARFTQYGGNRTRAIYKWIKVITNDTFKVAEVDLSTGELNCYDAAIQHQ